MSVSSAEDSVHFALLIPMSGSWAGGPQIAGAAALAVETVNADKNLLPDRVLEYSWADSGCSAQQGLKAMGELLQGGSKIDAVIGLRSWEVEFFTKSGPPKAQMS